MDVEHNGLCADAGLDDDLLDVIKQLNTTLFTFSELMPIES